MTIPRRLALGSAQALTLVFWWLVLLNLMSPFPQPFFAWMGMAGACMLALHAAELLVFNRQLKGRAHPWLDRLLILVLGIFFLQSFPRRAASVCD